MAMRAKQRVIYTSPIKALSNQKFRELQREFKDVGLMTGDVSINKEATILVMTTEILRNMLYLGSDVTREMAWVIFDEVHYMKDRERGVVWEETFILMSNTVKCVFLSATIPNARQFAEWIAKIKSQPVNVIYTEYRPVPLEIYLHAQNSEGIYLIKDSGGKFREENFNKALQAINESHEITKLKDKKKKNDQPIKKIVELLRDNSLTPAIVFSFSRRQCELNAMQIKKVDLNTEEEKEIIRQIYTNAISTLSEEDQQIKQVQEMLPFIEQGIGIHHGGLLPIVKECVELIFQEGLIKILFSTETFSMGINMPAKTVVFTNLEKYDGENFRWLEGGECIQMCGRAGRRGLDSKGLVIMMLSKKMKVEECKEMLSGHSDVLLSSFQLKYNMLVNMMRVEGINPNYIVKRSFRQYQSECDLPLIMGEIKEIKKKLAQIPEGEDTNVSLMHLYMRKSDEVEKEMNKVIFKEENIKPFLVPGRLIRVREFGWGIVVNFRAENIIMKQDKGKSVRKLIVDTLLYVNKETDQNKNIQPGDMELRNGLMGVVPVELSRCDTISSIKFKLPVELKSETNLKQVEKVYFELFKRYKTIPLLTVKELGIEDPELVKLESRKLEIEQAKTNLPEITDYQQKQYSYYLQLKNEAEQKLETLENKREIVLADELERMKSVLRRLDFIDEDYVKNKGQVACCITSVDEILLTEMIFAGSLNDLDAGQLCQVLVILLSNVCL